MWELILIRVTVDLSVCRLLTDWRKKSCSRHSSSGKRKAIAIIAVAAALCTFTVTAAATNLFGFVTTKTGTYGLNVKMESTEVPEESKRDVDIVFGYMPDTYKENGHSGGTGLTIVPMMSISMHIIIIPIMKWSKMWITPTS